MKRPYAQDFCERDRRVLQTGETSESEETVASDRGQRHYLTFKFPIQSQPGRQMLGGLSMDITERKLAELQFQSERERVQLLADAVPALISYVDSDARYQLVNRTYERWFGQPKVKVVGQHMRDVLGHDAWQVIKPYVETALSGKTLTYEAKVPFSEGEALWVGVTYTPDQTKDGVVCGFIAHVNNITTRKQAEQELEETRQYLETIIETAPSVIVIIDAQGKINLFNRASEMLTGYDREEVAGKSFLQLLVPADWREELKCKLADPDPEVLRQPHESPWITKTGQQRMI